MSEQSAAIAGPRIREAVAGDVAFISSTWKQHFWRESPWANRIRWSIFAPHHSEVIRRLLERASVLVACDPSREDEIAGYLVFETAPAAVHFAYVKPPFRRSGVFRALLTVSALPADLDGVAVTHATRAWFSSPPLLDKQTNAELRPGRPGLEAKFPKSIHDPYLWMES